MMNSARGTGAPTEPEDFHTHYDKKDEEEIESHKRDRVNHHCDEPLFDDFIHPRQD
jgi:hypothetical protein